MRPEAAAVCGCELATAAASWLSQSQVPSLQAPEAHSAGSPQAWPASFRQTVLVQAWFSAQSSSSWQVVGQAALVLKHSKSCLLKYYCLFIRIKLIWKV